MPRINRIRVSNIKYDNEKKLLPDLVFEAKSLDTLLILANGGGKSLLVQLILQVILPNARLGKRRMEDLLLSGSYTGHVAVEWLLDAVGEHKEFLCTGFCFSGGQSNDRSIRYYNYLFDYDDRGELTIGDLPLVYTDEKGGLRPIQYQKFKDWLREKGIQPIDRPETYQERLRIYRILPEEWKNIRDTNGAEGGVDKFFEKSRTTMQLMDNLLLPAVEEMIFQDEKKKRELVNAFAHHREMLLEIPLIKQNLQDFSLIRDAAGGVVEEVEALDLLQKEHAAVTEEIVKLVRSFYEFSLAAGKALEDLGLEQKKTAEKSRELDWQERSYKWFLKTLELRKREKAEKQAFGAYKTAEDRFREAEDSANRLNALYYFEESQKAKENELQRRQELKLMEQSEPELHRQLRAKKILLKAAWKERKAELREHLEAGKKELASLLKERDVLKKQQAAARKEEAILYKEAGALEDWLKDYEQKKKDLSAVVEVKTVLDPAGALAERQESLKLLEQREQEMAASRERLALRAEELGQDILSLRNEKTRVEARAEGIREKLDQFRGEEETLRGALAGQGIFARDLSGEKEEVMLRVRDVLAGIQEKRLGLQADLANLQEKWALVEGRDYYVSHHDLLKIKNRLEKSGIYAVLGSEWLTGQPLSEKEKEELLQRQPLLPFAVLIEAGQVNGVKHIIRQDKEWTCDVPLLFLVKTGEFLQGEAAEGDFLPLRQEELYLFLPGTMEVYTSGEAFQELKDRLQDKIRDKEKNAREVIAEENTFMTLRENLAGFFRRYPGEQLRSWEKEAEGLQEALASLEQKILAGEEQRNRCREELTGLEKALGDIRLEQQALKGILEKIKIFHQLHLLYPEKKAREEALKSKLEAAALELRETEERLEAMAGKEHGIRRRQEDLDAVAASLEKDFTRYRLDETEPGDAPGEVALCIPVVYENARMEVESILGQLDKKQGERANIQKLLETAAEQVRNYLFEVEKTGVEIEWLEANRQPVTRQDIKEAEIAAGKLKRLGDEKEKAWGDAKLSAATARSLAESFAGGIGEEFGKEPYPGFSGENHELQIDSIRRSKKELAELVGRIGEEIKAREDWKKETLEAYEATGENMPLEVRRLWEQVTPYSLEEWKSFQDKPRKRLSRYEKEHREKENRIEGQKHVVNRGFERYLGRLEATANIKVRQFIRDVRAIMDENRIYDYDFVQDQFLRIFEGLDNYEAQYRNTLAECEKNKSHLVALCLRRAGSVYESVMELPKNSRVNIYDREIQVIRIDWPRQEEKEAGERMHRYIEQALEDLQALKGQGKKDDEINGIMEIKLKTRNLIQQVAPMENCRVTVYKPRKESMIRYGKPEYAPWDEVPKWSGGEEYSVYVTMFMIMLAHIRRRLEGRKATWKVLLADNPFGRASSSHVWEPVFQIARANLIQLVCLTAHKQEDILKRFPVVYSLQLRSFYGKEIMQSELMESGFYRLDTASGDGAQVMLPV